ncbi:hypothetical protein BIFPSEUDO_02754 [Bifidobacterium pseudocatenulatum DSM 20438 = JCM 1200 = LMG 10505]|uniref:Uncharacterized protein n=1 Tax=Bifidobacterium pseudocatenulatum DSM 20438 = JCM 1200 = LMG 10505 TaxID=547043 RepID=C0BQV0_BIFPS|nr:hypothetical protein BIFPSEUDO_02754 [Bifidobacterium pseudocatenulatum DSM 20438 = JCM 1200 = LMG 10505]
MESLRDFTNRICCHSPSHFYDFLGFSSDFAIPCDCQSSENTLSTILAFKFT